MESQNAMPALTASTSFVDGDARAAYLPAENLRRRRLSVGQKAMIGGKVVNLPAPRPPIGAAAREKIWAHGQIRYGVSREEGARATA